MNHQQCTKSLEQSSDKNLIQKAVPLAKKTWFETGGAAEYYAAPTSNAAFIQSITFAQQQNMPITILGAGANCLINDAGITGLVIQPQMQHIAHHIINKQVAYVTAGAGAHMADVIMYCFSHNIIGLEEFSGIPGTIGGSVYINLHYFNFLLAQFIVQATLFDITNNSIITVSNEWFNFGYDYSKLHEKKHILLDATFALTHTDPLETAFSKGRAQEIIRHRKARYPYKGTCGSFFRNFHDHEVSYYSNGKKMIYAAYYLDAVGVKGTLSHNGATVSYQHANMIVNNGTATTDDIIFVARDMQEKVHKKFGILLQPECELLGFNKSPLHTEKSIKS